MSIIKQNKKNMIILTAVATMLISYEGIKYESYKDIGNVKTICYGHTGKDILDKTYNLKECRKLLNIDIQKAISELDRCITTPMPQSVQKAFISAIYNTGSKIVCGDTKVREYLLKRDFVKACKQLPRWNKVKNKEIKGLTKRRIAEMNICLEDLSI